ncbi:uncharacterized protein LOC124895417 [Capsicum annuum]|uniref:uncharacterized protein LOC124895417 n=1 Tax=Capsicum annuum TaxID=4072 RepID=UPI001FB0B0B3|nr:uncharacterized protein LOC124895417 [Capsicum annuum]
MTFEKPKQRPQWLPLAEWWYNTTYHTVTHLTPYEVVYGQKPPPLLPYMPFDSALETVDRSLQDREATLRALKSHLEIAQGRMKVQVDRRRTDRTYAVCDQVYVKLQPYQQISLKDHSFQKLSENFYGPFSIIAKVGLIVYTLALPPHQNIHPTFHISQLKKRIGDYVAAVQLLVVHTKSGYVILATKTILERRMAPKRGTAVTQVLVKWFNAPVEDSTWEDL